MKAPTTKLRFAEAQKLLDYGFSNYSYIKLGDNGDTVKSVPISKGIEANINATVENTSGVLISKGKEKQIEQNIFALSDNLSYKKTRCRISDTLKFLHHSHSWVTCWHSWYIFFNLCYNGFCCK